MHPRAPMVRTAHLPLALTLSAALAGLAAFVGPACAHRPDRIATTEVRSGEMGGVRVTNVSSDDRTTRLAEELCHRAEACGHVGNRDKRWPTDGACIADVERDLPRKLGAWTCAPESSVARFEECLAAIRSAKCEAPVEDHMDALTACRADAVCPPAR